MPDEQSMYQMRPVESMHSMNGHETVGHLKMQDE
jgi:hypothetical protein